MLNLNQKMLQYELDEDVSEENVQIFQKYRQAAEQGQAEAQCHLGLMYQQGQFVPQDDALAIHWLRRAAEQGQVDAQNQLGLFYKGAPSVSAPDDQADALAIELFSNAAKQGHTEAQYNLGLLYKVGKGISQSYTEARYWLSKAAEQGYLQARNILRLMPPIPMTNRRLFLLLSSIGLTSSFFALTGCDNKSGNRRDDSGSGG